MIVCTETVREEMKRRRPLIGITMRQELQTERFYLARFYSEAVEAAGGGPVQIPLIPKHSYIKAVAERLHGRLLAGSTSDVEPQIYTRGPPTTHWGIHPLRDSAGL